MEPIPYPWRPVLSSKSVRRARYFPRPLGLAGTAAELPFALACLLLLLALFAGDLMEPPRRVIGIIDVVPMLAAAWLLSTAVAAVICLGSVALLILTGVMGVVDWVTVSIEVTTFVLIAVFARLYAQSLLDVLSFPRRRAFAATRSTFSGEGIRSLAGSVPQGIEALSQREREVARLAAEGLTAREIGDRLFIGERTVETHLAHAYAKLGISSRLELIKLASKLEI